MKPLKPLTVEERRIVAHFTEGVGIHALSKEERLPVQTVERLIRRAMGAPSNGVRRIAAQEEGHGAFCG